ncbi:MAG: PadR family transcriptional regulator [Acidobacteriia bacterium]|nr:PadR family transcriptional regulator [Terriglobia bacterium]
MRLTEEKYSEAHELYSGLIRLHILRHASQEGVFGLGIIEELARHGYKLSAGTLYPLLHNMEKKGLLRSHEFLEAGKIRRIYKSTPAGRKALSMAREKVRQLFGALFEDLPKRQARRKRT